MMYIARVSKELGSETMFIVRTGERIEWFACGRKGSYLIKGLGKTPKLSLFARGKSVMSQFRKGWIKPEHMSVLRSYTLAPIHPHGRPNTPGFPGTRTKVPKTLTDVLSTDLSNHFLPPNAKLWPTMSYNPHGFAQGLTLSSSSKLGYSARIFSLQDAKMSWNIYFESQIRPSFYNGFEERNQVWGSIR